jgi:hypothetical protein
MASGAPPAVVIHIGLESLAPRVLLDCMNQAEEVRLIDWIRSQDGLAVLVQRAIDLAEEARAA